MRWFGGGFRCKAKPDCFGSDHHNPQSRAERGCYDCRWADACLKAQSATVVDPADNDPMKETEIMFEIADMPSCKNISESEAMAFLESAGQGCISGRLSEWPQLIPSCRWAYETIKLLHNQAYELQRQLNVDQFPKYAILNDFDKPCPRLVAQLVNGKYYYLSRLEEPSMQQYDGMIPERPTDIQDFGFSILERGGIVHFTMQQDSVAKYRDPRGLPPFSNIRGWQDKGNYFHYKIVTMEDIEHADAE